ncbi:MAG: TonB family protein [Sphingomonas bacterium]|nr:TonB family protein [Sphingomonas bacterium]
MLAYAPRPDTRRLRPATLGLIILGHVGLLALVMTAESGIVPTNPFTPTTVILVPEPKPPVLPPEPQPDPRPRQSQITTVDPIVPPLTSPGPTIVELPLPLPIPGPVVGNGTLPTPIPLDLPIVRKGPRFATVGDAIRPPYPISKREAGDEASLRLRLSIDARGRVIAVDAVGRADPTFLEAARRHILRAWRYQPAMEGAKSVPSTTTITLKFELGNA